MNQIWLAFITGLTAGGVSCLAVQGGLLASSLAQVPQGKKRISTLIFLWSKLLSYTVLGGLLGLFGSSLNITPSFQGWLQIAAGVYMLITAANLLELHPIFRYAVIQPPKWAYRLLKKESRRESFGPAFLGALTVLIPCGITQGMIVMAISSGSPLIGAGILGAFTLGTSPLFFILGFAAAEFMKKRAFVYVASALVFVLGVNAISAGNGLRGSAHTLSNYWNVIVNPTGNEQSGNVATVSSEGKQEVTINVTSNGYEASATKIKAGVPVKLTLVSKDTVGCARAFTIPSLNIQKVLPATGEGVIEFTPTKTGRLAFSCSMGMYSGAFQVI